MEAANFLTTKVICLMSSGFLIMAVTVVIVKEADDKKKEVGAKEVDKRKGKKHGGQREKKGWI